MTHNAHDSGDFIVNRRRAVERDLMGALGGVESYVIHPPDDSPDRLPSLVGLMR